MTWGGCVSLPLPFPSPLPSPLSTLCLPFLSPLPLPTPADQQTFGAYLSEHPRPAPGYFGNGECFLWRASALAALPPPPSADAAPARSTTIAPDLLTGEDAPAPPASPAAAAAAPPPPALRFKAFPYSGENEYCINCETGFLSMGAGDGHYGLWLDGGLARGRSGRSLTFGNEPLSDEGDKFGVLGVELWVLGA
ncbi:oxidation resistance protein [Verticillium dahliae]|nr:oxidation resistance protein [Verticillium dahliae]